jgi:hypothetical protein
MTGMAGDIDLTDHIVFSLNLARMVSSLYHITTYLPNRFELNKRGNYPLLIASSYAAWIS